MKAILLPLILIIVPAFCLAQDHTPRVTPTPVPPPVTRPAADPWVRYNSNAGRYSVFLPGQPALSTQQAESADGIKFPQYVTTATSDTALYMIIYFDLPSPGFSFDRARDLMLGSLKGTLLGESAISLGGHPGRELNMVGKSSDGVTFQIHARIYQIKNRIFMLQYIYQPESADDSTIRNQNKYFDSFSVESGQ